MSLLDDDQVAALVDAAREGRLEEGQYLSAPRRRPPNIRAVDFRRTVKFKAAHQERIKRAMDLFCRTASSRVSTALRTAADIQPSGAEQGMWSRAHADIHPAATCLVLRGADEQAAPVVLAVAAPLVLEAVDRLLGSDGTAPVRRRALTEVDRRVALPLFATLRDCLGSAWKELCGHDLVLDGVRRVEQASEVCAVEEPTLVLGAKVRIARVTTEIELLVPFAAISKLIGRLEHPHVQDRPTRATLETSLARVAIELRAVVGEITLDAGDVLALEPGDLVRLGARAARGVTLYADRVPLHPAAPGRNGGRRAVQLDSALAGTG